MSYGYLVVGVEYEAVLWAQVAGYPELGPYVVLHIVVVAVQMVRRDVSYDGDVRAEVIASVQLKAADFQNVVVVFLGRHLECVAFSYVSSQSHVQTRLLEQVVDERCSGGLAVRPRYAYFLRVVIARRELDFGNYRGVQGLELFDDGYARRNAWTLYNLVGRENFLLRVTAFLIIDSPFVEGFLIFRLYLPVV